MLEALINKIKEMNIDSMFIYNKHNVRYLSGYKGDDSYLIISEKGKYFITDPRYTEQAKLECPQFEIINWRSKGSNIASAINYIVKKENMSTLGIEDSYISLKQYKEIEESTGIKLLTASGIIENLRTVKSSQEIEYAKKACEISDRAFSRILNDIKVGITEKELSAKLAYYLKSEGSDARCYENILLSGSRTSLLHGIPSGKKVEHGDLVLMDFGAGYNGYLSDMSRTVIVGKANDEQKKIYSIIKESEKNAIDSIKSNIHVTNVYNASLKPINGTKYFDYHYTGIGHGVGLAVHEEPFISPRSKDVLQKNNIITIEPGIYIPGWGGVRIEDQVVVTDDGCEIMTNSSRQLIEL